jgi:hypothetical protein
MVHFLRSLLLAVALVSPFLFATSFAANCNLNGCTLEDAVPATTVLFPTDDGIELSLAYSPPCVHVDEGSTVTFGRIFVATFADHPLRGGVYDPLTDNVTWTTDESSPFFESYGDAEEWRNYEFPAKGIYPFLAEDAYYLGMGGVVYVGDVDCSVPTPVPAPTPSTAEAPTSTTPQANEPSAAAPSTGGSPSSGPGADAPTAGTAPDAPAPGNVQVDAPVPETATASSSSILSISLSALTIGSIVMILA